MCAVCTVCTVCTVYTLCVVCVSFELKTVAYSHFVEINNGVSVITITFT